MVEIERRRKNLKEEVETQVTERKARIKEHEIMVSKELEKKYEIFRRHHEAVDKLKRYRFECSYFLLRVEHSIESPLFQALETMWVSSLYIKV